MQSTMNLLAEAEKVKDLGAWAEDLGLTKRVLYSAKYRGNLSPAVAGALAEKMGMDEREWIVVAALESERDSACKTRMVRKILGRAALAAVYGLAVSAMFLIAPSQALAKHASLYIM